MKEKYEFYREKYDQHIILIKSGNFYIALNDDALILNKIFKYKIKEVSQYIKVGFPLSNLNKVLIRLIELNISYAVIGDIIDSETFRYNKYFEYYVSYDSLIYRINRVNEVLKNNLVNNKLNNVLNNIEKCLCKIN